MTEEKMISMHWFRKGLRLHDNPALLAACKASKYVYPIIVMDPYFAKPDIIGVNRYSFYLQSLQNLDDNLRSIGSRLFVLKGTPEDQIPLYVEKWGIEYVTFERDTEPYAKVRDKNICSILKNKGVKVESFTSHTLFDYDTYIDTLKGKSAPSTNGQFVNL
jgi:cryptochrome